MRKWKWKFVPTGESQKAAESADRGGTTKVRQCSAAGSQEMALKIDSLQCKARPQI